MKPELKAKWLAALRGGSYKQAVMQLRDDEGFCCLGVLLDLSKRGSWDGARYEWEDDGELWSAEGDLCLLAGHFDLTEDQQNQLVNMNDGHQAKGIRRHTFAEIADYIESNL